MWYCGQRNEEFAKVCRERDELKRELEELREKLDAAIDGNVNLRIHMEKVQEERDALEKALKSCDGCCAVCVHENDRPDCDGNCTGCKEKCHCYTCSRKNENFVWVGMEADRG